MNYQNQQTATHRKEFPSDFKLKLRNGILAWIFNIRSERNITLFQSIHDEHAHFACKINNASRSFIYKAKVYHYPYADLKDEYADKFKVKVTLDNSISEQMEAYLKEFNLLTKCRAQLGAYVNKLLAMCNSMADFYYVVPVEMQSCFSDSMQEVNTDSKTTVTPEQLERFHKRNTVGADVMKQQIMINLLISRNG